MKNAFYLKVTPPTEDYKKEWYQLIVKDTYAVLSCGSIEQVKNCFKRYCIEYGEDIYSFLGDVSPLERTVSSAAREQREVFFKEKGHELNYLLEEWYDECFKERKKNFAKKLKGHKIKRNLLIL